MQIIVDENSEKSIAQVTVGKHFLQFLDSQMASATKKKGLSHEGRENLLHETVDILSHCNPHYAVNNSESTHLVVGYVQSGKTMSFTALTALALDNNYRLIVYLTGTKNNLLEQTAKRLRKDLIGESGELRNYYKIHVKPQEIEDVIGHMNLSDKPIILIPILKHYDQINKLADLFSTNEFIKTTAEETVLIIDDEADQASLNSYGRKNSKEATDFASSTYAAILRLRSVLHGNSYVQYTATPQANLLISMQDLLSPKHHTVLTPGEGYVGGKEFFGKGKDHELYNGGLIINIPNVEVFHKKDNFLHAMPNSLRQALMLHILAVCIVVKYFKKVPYLSMMVHPDNTKMCNKMFKSWIDDELQNWRSLLSYPENDFDRAQLIEDFKGMYGEAVKYYEDKPSFDAIKVYLKDVLNDKKVWLVNSDLDAETEIAWDEYSMHVLVGAEMLNRGFTIENLATTYMPRYSKGISTADTIQQRCRFFGYKKAYIESCRVFVPVWTRHDYEEYVDHEEEMRTTLKECSTLSAAEHRLMLSPTLKPTRANVLPISVVNTILRGMHGLQAFETKGLINHNSKLVEDFLQKHGEGFSKDIIEYGTLDRTHRRMKIDINEAINFLTDFSFANYKDAMQKSNTIRYLRYLSFRENNPLKYVYFIQMAYGAPIRHRSFDKLKGRFAENTDLFAGPSSSTDSTNYPGDRKMVGDVDSITIQLYHFYLDGAPIQLPSEAYTIAIYYPEELASSYCSNKDIPEYYDTEDDE